MKSVIVFSIIVTFYVDGGDAAINPGTAAITRLKNSVLSTTNDLTRYSRGLSSGLNTKIYNLKFNQINNINGIVNPAIDDVRKMISAAGTNGTNAEHCFEPARLRLREASLNGFKKLDGCAETGKSTINPLIGNIDATVLLGSRIVNDLDAIAINCYSSNGMQMQNCIIGKIPDASATVQAFQNTANELKRTGDSLSSSAVNTAMSCNLEVTPKVQQEATSVRVDTKKCINNAGLST